MEHSTDTPLGVGTPVAASTTPANAAVGARAASATSTQAPTVVPYSELYRPQYHFSAQSGWLGDPDGMIRYKSIYHVFWWGHAESSDLVHWRQRPDPMVGDDGSFVYFSGSVVVDEHNTSKFGDGDEPPMIAIYTMHDKASGREVQGLSASRDYTSFQFYKENPVLKAEHGAFRDPQVFRYDPTDQWIMVITVPEARQVHFYGSQDLKRWDYLSEFGPIGAQAEVWEVPDLFRLPVDGDPATTKWVLLCGMGPNRVQYFVGDFDGRSFTLDPAANSYLLTGAGMPGTVFASFERGLPASWQVGDRGHVTEHAGMPLRERATGPLGTTVLSTASYSAPHADETLRITSPSFVIQDTAINFLLAGGGDPTARVNLVVRGAVERTAFGNNTPYMHWVGWDVSAFKGAEGRLEILDANITADARPLAIGPVIFSNQLMATGPEHANWLDFGPDYYAVRTYRDYDAVENRTVTLGWMGNWEYANAVPTTWGKGALALPRELSLQSFSGGLRLMQQPIPAVEQLRQPGVHLEHLEVNGRYALHSFAPRHNTYEIDVTFAVVDPDARFGLSLAHADDHDVSVGYDAAMSTAFVNRMRAANAGFSGTFPKYATAPLEPRDGTVRLHIFVDQSSVEVFANDGERTLTALMFPDPESTTIELFSTNGRTRVTTLRAWELRSIWNTR